MDTGARIRKLRTEQKLTQIELAQKAGVAINSLRLYEGGKRQPQAKQLSLLADALNVPVSTLTTPEDPQDLMKPKSANFYPTEMDRAIFCMTTLDGSVHVMTNYPIVPFMEDIPWRISKKDTELVEAILKTCYDNKVENPLPPEVGAAIITLLDKFAEKSKLLAESSSE